MLKHTDEAVKIADHLIRSYGTRDADRLAAALGIIVMPRHFKHQKGVYKVISRNRYIFIKDDLHPAMRSIVLLHEIGHDQLHRKEAVSAGGFQEFDIFNMADHVMEYEANMFAAQIALPDEEMLEYILGGYNVAEIARMMHSDINLVALKAADLNRRGHNLQAQEFRCDFLK